jgi:glycosidase
MDNITKVLNILTEREKNFNSNFYIPIAWNTFSFRNLKESKSNYEINVNPYSFYKYCIETVILKERKIEKNYINEINLELSSSDESIIYGLIPKMYSSWDHYKKGFCNGSMLKMICLIPYLKKMNVNIIYMLPIFESSDLYKKGDVGSPYAIKNLYKIDKSLHDELLGEYSEDLMNIEFKAFIEACHIMGIKVMIDFVFRTVSRDNDIILKNPEWFYWIDKNKNDNFKVPYIKSLKEPESINEKLIENLYESKDEIDKYVENFSFAPNLLDKEKWENIKKDYNFKNKNLLNIIEEEFNITTAPGFSDVINDNQPFWSDVTYLRYYKDRSFLSEKHYDNKNYPPYILQDSAKLNLFYGKEKNNELWDYILNVIPYYQKDFGIDGARIDMGHAMPTDLLNEILETVKKYNENFIFWSEEFSPEKSEEAKKNGFDFISGSIWNTYKNYNNKKFNEYLSKDLENSKIPLISSPETPDTPRAMFYHNNKEQYDSIFYLSLILPNSIIYLNCGMELKEIQPMNLGLDNTEKGRYLLDKSDPMYGKLAFFDNYIFHWQNIEEKNDFIDKLNYILQIKKNLKYLISFENLNLELLKTSLEIKMFTILYFEKQNEKLLILINRDLENELESNKIKKLFENIKYFELIFSSKDRSKKDDVSILKSGEFVIYKLNQR